MQRLVEGARALGLRLTPEQQAAFQLYYEELVAWNEKFNLTAITEYEPVQIRHFLDSLSCLLAEEARQALKRPEARVIDVGSGAGFPGIPLKLVCSGIRLTLLEAMLLKLLVERRGQVVTKAEILEKVWNLNPDTETRAVDNFVMRLRRHLEDDPRSPRLLQTVRGIGYRLADE
jgi:DNA-binding response OmpR family regulator